MPISSRVLASDPIALGGNRRDAEPPVRLIDWTEPPVTECLAGHCRDRSDAVHHEINSYVVTSIAGIASGNSPPLN